MLDGNNLTDTDSAYRQRSASRPKRDYSDATKAKALTALQLNEGNYSRTARQVNIPLATIRNWNLGMVNDDVTNIANHQKKELADRFEDLAHLFITQATETVDSSKGTQAIIGAATATDKMRLLRDQSTANLAVAEIRTSFAAHLREQGHDEAEAARLAAKAYGESDDK